MPGSGKTYTLAALVTRLLQRDVLKEDGEILVVTFTNSAVDNIKNRIRRMLTDVGLPAEIGYRVFTLHGLANAILRERPDLAGTTSDYRVDDELSGQQSMPEAVRWFIQQEQAYWQSFLPSDLPPQRRIQIEDDWRDQTIRLGTEVTKLAKNMRLTPMALNKLISLRSGEDLGEEIRGRFAGDDETSATSSPHLITPSPHHPLASSLASASPFLRIGAAIYERYDRILKIGGRLDFDDLIWGAIQVMENDDGFRARLEQRWQYILEDEAQDSTPLQERILGMLARDHGNWVRVGDPNQAIMTTFTASDVRFFREYMQRADVQTLPLPVSGRSAQKIIDLANRLADWAVREHPEPEIRTMALDSSNPIQPTTLEDLQRNPPDERARIHVQAYAEEDMEIDKVSQGATRFILANPERTCAILTPTNAMGKRIVDALEKQQAKYPDRIIYQDQLKNPQVVRNVARLLASAVKYCAIPTNTSALVDLHIALGELAGGGQRVGDSNQKVEGSGQRAEGGEQRAVGSEQNETTDHVPRPTPHALRSTSPPTSRLRTLLRSANPERLLYPVPDGAPALSDKIEVTAAEQSELQRIATLAAKWLRASALPIDQLLLTIAQDSLTRDSDLAIAHSLAVSMRRLVSVNPNTQLIDLAINLEDVAANRQRFLSNALIESGFEPVPGIITITTMHKAKGLEWDRVYLTAVDEGEFPHDSDVRFRGQLWYLNNHDPATEARKELEALMRTEDEGRGAKGEGRQPGGIRAAHLEYIAERLRLLYVGITRARSELAISYSKERFGREGRLALAVARIVE